MRTVEWLAPLVLILVAFGLAAFVNGPRRLRLALSPSFIVLLGSCALLLHYLARGTRIPMLFLVGFAMATILAGVARATPLVTVRRMILRLGHPRLRPGALDYIHRWAQLFRPGAHEERVVPIYTNVVCTAAGTLLGCDRVEDADALLELLPADLGDPKLEVLRATLVAMTKVSLGQVEAAREALSRAPDEAGEGAGAQLLTMARALVAAVAGEVEEASRYVEATGDDAKLSGFRLAIQAHVHAARGQREQAREALAELGRVGGATAVLRVAGQGGPASPLAAKLLAEKSESGEE